jgi:hypothetical protein
MDDTKEEVTTRLRAIREEREKLRAAREAELAAKSPEEELAQEEALLALEKAVVEAEAKHGTLNKRIVIVHAKRPDGSIAGSAIIHRGSRQHWSRYRKQLQDGTVDGEQAEAALVMQAVAWPSLERFQAVVDEMPHFMSTCAIAVARLNGLRLEEVAGKP